MAGITHHESLICCEEFPEYEREQVTVPIALSWTFRVTKVFNDRCLFLKTDSYLMSEEQFTSEITSLHSKFIFLVVIMI